MFSCDIGMVTFFLVSHAASRWMFVTKENFMQVANVNYEICGARGFVGRNLSGFYGLNFH